MYFVQNWYDFYVILLWLQSIFGSLSSDSASRAFNALHRSGTRFWPRSATFWERGLHRTSHARSRHYCKHYQEKYGGLFRPSQRFHSKSGIWIWNASNVSRSEVCLKTLGLLFEIFSQTFATNSMFSFCLVLFIFGLVVTCEVVCSPRRKKALKYKKFKY